MENTESRIMDEDALRRAMMRISHEITERNKGTENVVIAGIKRRGVPLAEMICENLKKIENVDVPFGILDISFYRDDLTKLSQMPELNGCSLPYDVNEKKVILVDDVIFTGRTARAAIEAVFSLGRPREIQLATLIDRGHRQLPIRPDFVGKNIPTSLTEKVLVKLPEYDDAMGVVLTKR